MYFGGAEVVAVGVCELVYDDLVEEGLDGLEVGHVRSVLWTMVSASSMLEHSRNGNKL